MKPDVNAAQELDIIPDPEMIDDDAPEWTDEMNARAIGFTDLPPSLQAKIRAIKGGRPKAADPKRVVTLRLKTSLFAAYEALGPDWRARMEKVLTEGLKADPAAKAG
jgi:uncharacterized protein (DUF4415 family)